MTKVINYGYFYFGLFMLVIASVSVNYLNNYISIIWAIWGGSYIILSGLLANNNGD